MSVAQSSQHSPALHLALTLGLCVAAARCAANPSPAPSAPDATQGAEAVATPSAAGQAEPNTADLSLRSVVEASDRLPEDKQLDERRKPLGMLEFFEVGLGERVADLGAGSGYTTELLARAVGRSGVVYSQNDRRTLSMHIAETWQERLRRESLNNVVAMTTDLDSPFTPEATQLDLVTFLFSYHDAVASGVDRDRLNRAIFSALKPGRLYVVADHEAPPGSGLAAAAELHRIESSIVRREIERAGFEFVESSQLLRAPGDDTHAASPSVDFKTDRYVLKFRRPL